MQYQNKEAINSELFGARGKSAVIDLPSHLGHLAANLPAGHLLTVERLIDDHTLLPVFAPFLTKKRVERLRTAMSSRQGSAVHKIAGIGPASIRMFDWLRYCPSCAEDDRTQFGECYWHRIHQVSGVEVCHKHQAYIEDSSVPARNRVNSAVYISAQQAGLSLQSRPADPGGSHVRILSRISEDISWLLNQRGLVPSFDALHEAYNSVLIENNLASNGGRLRCRQLLNELNTFYDQELLKKLQCAFDAEKSWSWPFRLVNELVINKSNPPIRHLLLIQLCGYAAEGFFKLCKEFQPTPRAISVKPFGDGPWPCLNPTCDDYCKKIIKNCEVRKHWSDRDLRVGFFACHCGFVYSRNGHDTTSNDCFRVDHIKVYGPLWDAELYRLWEDLSLSLTSIARRLGVSHNTIKYQAIRLDLEFPRSGAKVVQMNERIRARTTKTKHAKTSYSESVQIYRQQWLDLMAVHPSANRTGLAKQNNKLYYWLLHHDRDWLLANSPSPFKRTTNRKVDWVDRDISLASQVRVSAIRLRNASGIPHRVTIQSIRRDIDRKDLVSKKQLSKLPLTKKVLTEVVETKVEFYTRRLTWAANYFRRERTVPSFSALGLKATLDWKSWYIPEIKLVFETVIESLRREAEADWIASAELNN